MAFNYLVLCEYCALGKIVYNLNHRSTITIFCFGEKANPKNIPESLPVFHCHL